MSNESLELKDTVILFDRDLGVSIFQNFRGYNNLMDDAEWLLERTPQKSRGFIIRPVGRAKQAGVWIGEYSNRANRVVRQEILFDRGSSSLSKAVSNYATHKITERTLLDRVAIDALKKKLKSGIIRDFKYYLCPIQRFYASCVHIERVYEALKKYRDAEKIPYSVVAEEIEKTKPCDDVVMCPLMVPNSLERVLNLAKALRSRGMGEIGFLGSDLVKII